MRTPVPAGSFLRDDGPEPISFHERNLADPSAGRLEGVRDSPAFVLAAENAEFRFQQRRLLVVELVFERSPIRRVPVRRVPVRALASLADRIRVAEFVPLGRKVCGNCTCALRRLGRVPLPGRATRVLPHRRRLRRVGRRRHADLSSGQALAFRPCQASASVKSPQACIITRAAASLPERKAPSIYPKCAICVCSPAKNSRS